MLQLLITLIKILAKRKFLSEQMLKNPIMSEYYLDLMLNDDNIQKYKNGSRYSKAMLYTRMHSQEIQSIEKSERLLEQAYDAIVNSSEYVENHPSAIFSALFNRNGYALVLFRKDRVEEAKDLMVDCINKIDKLSIHDREEELELYRSVLVYNLAQCVHFINKPTIDSAINGIIQNDKV